MLARMLTCFAFIRKTRGRSTRFNFSIPSKKNKKEAIFSGIFFLYVKYFILLGAKERSDGFTNALSSVVWTHPFGERKLKKKLVNTQVTRTYGRNWRHVTMMEAFNIFPKIIVLPLAWLDSFCEKEGPTIAVLVGKSASSRALRTDFERSCPGLRTHANQIVWIRVMPLPYLWPMCIRTKENTI